MCYLGKSDIFKIDYGIHEIMERFKDWSVGEVSVKLGKAFYNCFMDETVEAAIDGPKPGWLGQIWLHEIAL